MLLEARVATRSSCRCVYETLWTRWLIRILSMFTELIMCNYRSRDARLASRLSRNPRISVQARSRPTACETPLDPRDRSNDRWQSLENLRRAIKISARFSFFLPFSFPFAFNVPFNREHSEDPEAVVDDSISCYRFTMTLRSWFSFAGVTITVNR